MSIRCIFGSHALYIIKEFSHTSRKVGCQRCSKTWGMHDCVQAFVPWDGDFDALYADWPPFERESP